MAIVLIVSIIINIILIGLLISYRRQVKSICRQIGIQRRTDTNYMFTSDISRKEFTSLIHELNELKQEWTTKLIESEKNDNRLKETISSLSHDIRTPLTSMDGYFQLLCNSTDEAERERYIDVIHGRIDDLRDILEELFTYTKLQDSSYELELDDVELSGTIFDTIVSFYDGFSKAGIEPELDISEIPVKIKGNSTALSRVFANIIKNSVLHSKSKVKIKYERSFGWAVFTCSNDVDKPDEIDVNRVFNRFYKADAARSKTSTGLGLAIAKGLTENMGGRIESKLEGDIFSIVVRFKV